MRIWLLASAVAASASLAGLTGTSVCAELGAAAGGFAQTCAVVGPEVEFTGYAGGMNIVALDISDATLAFEIVNAAPGNDFNPDGMVKLGLREVRVWNLIASDGAATALTLISSTFPPGTFDDLTVAAGTMTWKAPVLIMPGRGTVWRAVWEIGRKP